MLGGLTIHRKREPAAEHPSFTCPSCGKVFSNALRAQVYGGQQQTRSYDACPYCLTEVAVIDSNPAPELDLDGSQGSIRDKLEKLRVKAESERLKTAEANAASCKHSFGYLSTKSSKEAIPEECITCEKIVQCMLKAVKP